MFINTPMPTEFEIIEQITRGVPRVASGLVKGCGDDCAVIEGPNNLSYLITTDALVQGVHFKTEWTDLATLGRKALSVNLSDIAAMGGEPKFYLVSIGVPSNLAAQNIDEIYNGFAHIASEYNVLLIGGDTVLSPSGIVISITVIGEVIKGKAIFRSGAKNGDYIYVTGQIGSSALGLACLKKNILNDLTLPFVRCHNNPIPRLDIGKWLCQTDMITAMIDISDGLIQDLGHIADQSHVGFKIENSNIPTDPKFNIVAKKIGEDPIYLMLAGGEDYELLFTVARDKKEEFDRLSEGRSDITPIGIVTGDKKVRKITDANGRKIELKQCGYDHFKN